METLKYWSENFKVFRKDNREYLKKFFFHTECYEKKHANFFMGFLFHGAIDVNMICPTDDSGDTLLHRAAASGNVAVVCLLLGMRDTDMNIKNKNGFTAAEIICSKINPNGELGQVIVKNKYKHSRYTVDKKECPLVVPEYIKCEDANFQVYKELKSIFDEAPEFREPCVKKQKI